MCLLRVSGVAELSRPDPKMNDDGEGDDVWVELLPVQLVDTHRAGFLEEKEARRVSAHSQVAIRQPPFNHPLPVCEITNNPHLKGRLSRECNEMLVNAHNSDKAMSGDGLSKLLTLLSGRRLTSNMSSADSQITVGLSGVLRDQRKEL